MSATTDRAAQVIHRSVVAQVRGEMIEIVADDGVEFERRIAQALANAGLLATPERDAEQRRAGAVEALREAAEKYREADRGGYLFLAGKGPVPWDAVAVDLCADADRIEAQR